MAEIKNLYNDLTKKLNKENELFASQTENHNNRVNLLEGEIASAKEDIASATSNLENVLYPERKRLASTIATLKSNIAHNIATQKAEVAQRKAEHEGYVARQKDHANAKAALEEAIALVNGLANGKTSFIQMRSARRAINKLSNTMLGQNSIYTPLIHALLSLSKNFSDQGAVARVASLLKRMLNNVNASDKQEDATEAQQLKDHKASIAKLSAELKNFRANLVARQADEVENNKKIKAEEARLAKRKSDLANFTNQLAEENKNFAALTDAHNKLVAQIKNEQSTVQKAVKIIQNAQS